MTDAAVDDFAYGLVNDAASKAAFLRAWEDAFARRLPAPVYDWIFNDRNDLYIVRSGDDVAAGYGLLRVRAVLNGEEVEGAVCNNVFVTPAFQAKNLFVRLGRYALEAAQRRGTKIALGIPNPSAVAGHKRVGWTFFDPIRFLGIDRAALPDAGPLTVEALNAGNFASWKDRLETFALAQARGRGFSVIKDAAFFRWRYLERPATSYFIFVVPSVDGIRGYAVFKFYEPSGMLHLVDVEADGQDAMTSLLAAAKGLPPPFRALNTWGTTAHREKLIAAGFAPSADTNNLIFIHPYRKDPVAFRGELNLVLGDNDVY